MSAALAAALELHEAGIAVIPVRADGTKAPAVAWKQYIATPPTLEDLVTWFADTHQGLGIITGAVSGNLEMLEVEGRATDRLAELDEIAQASGLADLWQRIQTGWRELTPSGGIHWHYRVEGTVAGNTKLARQADHVTLAETRGEGGFSVIAPTPGSHHPSGKPWQRQVGGPATMPTLTSDERDAVHLLIRMLDELPYTEQPQATTAADAFLMGGEPSHEGNITPGGDYEQRVDWRDILTPHGWTLVFTEGSTRYWRRPGKNIGVSATTGHADDRDRLYVFTTSTAFASETPYTKFGAYALLEHDSDYSSAAKALAASGYGKRIEQPRPAPTVTLGPEQGEGAPDTPTTYTETDDGNALRLVDTYRDQIRYCPDRGLWLRWDGYRWRWDHSEYVRELARRVARNLPEAVTTERHRKASLGVRSIDAMVRLARTDNRVTVAMDQLDARPYELNTPAGVVNLRTGTLAAPDSSALHTRSTAVAPDFTTTPKRWLDFLATTFAGDPAMTTYVQRLLGVSLVGTVLEQVLPFGFGSGANGKSTLLSTIQRVVGRGQEGYSISAPAQMLTIQNAREHRAEIAQLSGARFVVASELEEGERFAEAKVKELTGGDAINARFMRENPFTFTPTHSLWLHANHQPEVRTGGPAIWRRLRLIPFIHTVPPEQRIADLEDRLVEDEGAAILAWIVQGARDYFTHGLQTPEGVLMATKAYEVDQDTVGRFVNECCERGEANSPGYRVQVSELYSKYETWCRVEGESAVSKKALTLALKTRYGVLSERSMNSRYYAGIRHADVSSDEPSEPEQREWFA